MIVFNNWTLTVTGLIARQYDNMSRRIDIEGPLPEGYTWQLLVQSGGNADTILLEATENGAGAVLTADNLSKAGEYYIQLRGVLEADGVTRRHTNVVNAYIPESLTGLGTWPAVPTEFAQVEARILELYQHPPIPGSNGYWFVWDTDKDEYVESQLALPEAAAVGTSDHSKLKNRDAADQHPMSAITGLDAALAGKQAAGNYLTDKDLDTTLTVDGKAADAAAVGARLDSLSEEIANLAGGNGLTTAQINALDGMFKVCAFIKADVSEEYNAFRTAFEIESATITGISATYSGGNVTAGTSVDALTGIVVTANYSDGSKRTVTGYTLSGTIAEGSNTITVTYEGMTTTFTVTGVAEEVTLSSISATYSGGDVPSGTALAELTGLVVTAHYSDGSQQNVTGYTLSGEIAKGENTITVTYGGMTTTFAVTGVADSGGEGSETNGWEDGVPYDLSNLINGYYINVDNGEAIEYATYSMTDYLPCHGASEIRVIEGSWGVYNAYYDENKQYVGQLRFDTNAKYVPKNAYYIRLSDNTNKFAKIVIAPIA